MYRRILLGGVTAAVILGAGGAALALTGSTTTTTSGTASSTSGTAHHRGNGRGRLLRRLAHAQIVTRGKDGFVTHDLINGTVTSVSPSSITVRAADNTAETFAVDKATKVVTRTAAAKGSPKTKPTASSISTVAKGDHVFVAGTGTSRFTAKHILDVKK